MKLDEKNRRFTIGRGQPITMTDCAHIALEPDEQVTFTTPAGGQYDVARKPWGFYATPSLNARLLDYKLRGVLIRGPAAKYYVLLVERGREQELETYLAAEQCVIARWLDNDADLRAIDSIPADQIAPPLHCPCGGDRFTSVHTYFAPPAGEVAFASTAGDYRREIYRCSLCGHYISVFALATNFYGGEYVDATYGDKMRATFDKIMALPPEQSDNTGRVARVNDFAAHNLLSDSKRILDVGSGLCVFLARMKEHGWKCTALDPDERAAAHARDVAGVEGIAGSLPMTGRTFDVVTFNKVLEHVADPIALLAHAKPLLDHDGFVYIELPDGEAAAREEGFGREEFFVEHFHVFSIASIACLAERAGFEVRVVERIREPSTKFTLRAFLTPRP